MFVHVCITTFKKVFMISKTVSARHAEKDLGNENWVSACSERFDGVPGLGPLLHDTGL
jgi:hypothetical protein